MTRRLCSLLWIYLCFFQTDRIRTKTGKKPTKQANKINSTSLPKSLLALSMNKGLNIKGTGKVATDLCPGKRDR